MFSSFYVRLKEIDFLKWLSKVAIKVLNWFNNISKLCSLFYCTNRLIKIWVNIKYEISNAFCWEIVLFILSSQFFLCSTPSSFCKRSLTLNFQLFSFISTPKSSPSVQRWRIQSWTVSFRSLKSSWILQHLSIKYFSWEMFSLTYLWFIKSCSSLFIIFLSS